MKIRSRLSRDLLDAIEASDLRKYELARFIRVAPSTLSGWLHDATRPVRGDLRVFALGCLVGIAPDACFADDTPRDAVSEAPLCSGSSCSPMTQIRRWFGPSRRRSAMKGSARWFGSGVMPEPLQATAVNRGAWLMRVASRLAMKSWLTCAASSGPACRGQSLWRWSGTRPRPSIAATRSLTQVRSETQRRDSTKQTGMQRACKHPLPAKPEIPPQSIPAKSFGKFSAGGGNRTHTPVKGTGF